MAAGSCNAGVQCFEFGAPLLSLKQQGEQVVPCADGASVVVCCSWIELEIECVIGNCPAFCHT